MSAVTTKAPYWPVPLVRAIPTIVVGLVITFSVDHSAKFGLIVFGIFAIATGIILAWGAYQFESRILALAQAAVSIILGVSALVLMTTGAGTLFLILISFAASTGFLELYQGLRSRGSNAAFRDWTTLGVLTSLLAIVLLLVPANYAAPWSVVDKGGTATGILTSQIIVVGIFGAYLILIGVYLVIGALSARWAILDNAKPTTSATTSATGQ